MRGVAIYMEGGGDRADGKNALRQGMDKLLEPVKAVARSNAWHWKLVPCGGRDAAFRAFRNAISAHSDAIVALLVDSEGPVSADTAPRAHLAQRDGWQLAAAQEDAVHLMVQVMETWIVADGNALRAYYGQGFNVNAMPRQRSLEDVPKGDVEEALRRATASTRKGTYHKIRHASEILARVDPDVVGQRCPHFERMCSWLAHQLAGDTRP